MLGCARGDHIRKGSRAGSTCQEGHSCEMMMMSSGHIRAYATAALPLHSSCANWPVLVLQLQAANLCCLGLRRQNCVLAQFMKAASFPPTSPLGLLQSATCKQTLQICPLAATLLFIHDIQYLIRIHVPPFPTSCVPSPISWEVLLSSLSKIFLGKEPLWNACYSAMQGVADVVASERPLARNYCH